MSSRPLRLQLDELTIEGSSRAGEETWFRVSPPGCAFDAGRGPLALSGVRRIFLTHGHLDHALGVPYLLSRRALEHPEGRQVYCPAEIAADLRALIAAAERLERTSYPYELVALAPGGRVEVARDLAVEAFAAAHVVPALGYHLLRRRRRLREELRTLAPGEIVELRRRGESVEEQVEERWLSYCGDSGSELFEREPSLYESRVLMVECTFFGERHRGRAHEFGHLHLADLVDRQDRFANETLVLYHLSRRHRREELEKEVARCLPRLAERVRLMVTEP